MCSATEIFFFCYFGRVLLDLLTIKTTARAWRLETSRNYERQRYATNKKGVPIKSDEGSENDEGSGWFCLEKIILTVSGGASNLCGAQR